jgi:hypothetical protein
MLRNTKLTFAAILLGGLLASGHALAEDNPCNPCGDNPCAENPCGDNPCGENPCGDEAAE